MVGSATFTIVWSSVFINIGEADNDQGDPTAALVDEAADATAWGVPRSRGAV